MKYSFLTSMLLGGVVSGQGVSYRGEKLKKIVDFTSGGITTLQGEYSTLVKAQLAGEEVVFVAYGGENLTNVGLFSADGSEITPLLEVGDGDTENDSTIRLSDFRDFGDGSPAVIPVVTQPNDEPIRLALLEDGELTQIVGASTVVPGSVDDQFLQMRSVVAHGHDVAFVGISRDERKGVYLYADGRLHDLFLAANPDEQLDPLLLGDEVIFDGEKVHFFHGDDASSRNIYRAGVDEEPTLVVEAFGVVDDDGITRAYRTDSNMGGEGGILTFLAQVQDDTGLFRWAFLQKGLDGLELIARSQGFVPMDAKSTNLSRKWRPLFDGVGGFLAGGSEVLEGPGDDSASAALKLFPGTPPVRIEDVENGTAVIMEAAILPKILWADLGEPGPVDIEVEPVSQAVPLNGDVNFSVFAEGLEPFTYEWYLNGELLSFATTDQLSLSGISYANVGTVRVVVRNSIDWDEAFAHLDVTQPPELTLPPVNRVAIAGEDLEVPFELRGQRPMSFEIIDSPGGHSLQIERVGTGGVFDVMAVTSAEVRQEESGVYTIRASNDSGSIDFTFNLSVSGVPANPDFGGKPFDLLADHRSGEMAGSPRGFTFNRGVVFDQVNDRFLTSPLVGGPSQVLAISQEGLIEEGVPGLEGRAISTVEPIGVDSDLGVIFKGVDISSGRFSLYTSWDGIISNFLSSSQIFSQLGMGPDFSRFQFSYLDGEVIGMVEESSGGEWAVIKVGEPLVELASSRDELPYLSAGGFLGVDPDLRPIFHDGFEESAVTPGRFYGPLIYRAEPGGRFSLLKAGFLKSEFIDESRTVRGIPSNSGIRFLSWGERVLELLEDDLVVNRVVRTRGGNPLFHPDFERARASRYRVFFPALVTEDDLTPEEFESLGLADEENDSVRRSVFSWSADGVSEVFNGRYLGGARENAGGFGREPLQLLNAVGDQVLIGGLMDSDGERGFLMWNAPTGVRDIELSVNRHREATFFDLPVGFRLESNRELSGEWSALEAKAGSYLIEPSGNREFFRARLK
ncbi:MAG: immunoglobulin domain-containing protein [Akkermansiaceae bacterium]